MLEAMHPRARQRFRNYGACWILGRAIFYQAARSIGLDIVYAAYVLEQWEIAELTGELREA